MRILFVHQSFSSLKDGGSGRANDFARRLVEDGHDVTCLAGTFNYLSGEIPEAFRRKFKVREQVDGYTVLRSWTYDGYHRSYFSRVVTFVSFMFSSMLTGMTERRYDVIAPCTPPFFLGITGYLLSLWHRAPIIYEIRDLWSEVAFQLGIVKNRWIIAAVRRLERFLYTRAQFIVVNSPGFIDPLKANGVSPERIRLIPNGVDLEEFCPRPEVRDRVRTEFNFGDKFIVLYAGSLGLANSLETVLETAHIMNSEPDVEFVFVGDGQRRRELEAYARRLALKNVKFIGAIPKQRVPEMLAASDCGVATLLDIPLFRTTYPNKVFDYMACGKPTILAIDGVIRDVINKSDGGIFVKPQDPAALAQGVRLLRDDPVKANRMGQNALAYVTEHFDRQKAEVLMSELVNQVSHAS